MSKPDITLEPSKGVISEMAAQIYAAYIIRGEVKDGEEAKWMQRSIREAVRIAKTVATSVETDDEADTSENTTASNGTAHVPATASKDTTPTPNIKEKTTESELDGIIDEALSGNAAPARKK